MKPEISIVIPAKNEEKSVEKLYNEVSKVLENLNRTFEIIFVDDGSVDETFKVLKSIRRKDNKAKVIKLRGNFGKSIALQSGFDLSKGDIIISLDADLQDDPKEIYKFLNLLNKGNDLVVGWKKKRRDPITKVISSRLFNFAVSSVTGLKIHDNNCGFKAYKREVLSDLDFHGELFRFIPVLAAKQNFKVTEVEVSHRTRLYGKSKFGLERGVKGLLDLVTIVLLTRFLYKPSHFFGGLGLITFFIGFLIGLYITYLRVTTGSIQYRHPLLFFGMLLMIIGVQLISTGLLGELMIHFGAKEKKQNYIKEILA